MARTKEEYNAYKAAWRAEQKAKREAGDPVAIARHKAALDSEAARRAARRADREGEQKARREAGDPVAIAEYRGALHVAKVTGASLGLNEDDVDRAIQRQEADGPGRERSGKRDSALLDGSEHDSDGEPLVKKWKKQRCAPIAQSLITAQAEVNSVAPGHSVMTASSTRDDEQSTRTGHTLPLLEGRDGEAFKAPQDQHHISVEAREPSVPAVKQEINNRDDEESRLPARLGAQNNPIELDDDANAATIIKSESTTEHPTNTETTSKEPTPKTASKIERTPATHEASISGSVIEPQPTKRSTITFTKVVTAAEKRERERDLRLRHIAREKRRIELEERRLALEEAGDREMAGSH